MFVYIDRSIIFDHPGKFEGHVTMSESDRVTMRFSTFVFCGITNSGPLSFNPRLLEIHLLALQRGDMLALPTQGIPRVTNKLTLSFNPEMSVIPTQVTHKTGLLTSMLEDQAGFNEDTVTILKAFIRRLQQPLCLISYDGDFSGFRVLNHELRRLHMQLDEDIYCVSIRRALRTFLPRYDSYNIERVYKALYGQTTNNESAEDTVFMLVSIVTKVLECIPWIDSNAKLLHSL